MKKPNRKPNTQCCICFAPLYRRPSDLKRSKNSYCDKHLKEHAKNREKGKEEYRRSVYKKYIREWKQGKQNGMKGKSSISGHIRRYLFERAENKCEKCSWAKTNPTTGLVPLEVNHIDGNHKNNKEENLELLCPNCHSLTSNFRSLNNGNGRQR